MEVARPKADLNVQASAPAQLAVGETGQLKTTLNNVSGDSADGVRNVPNFRLFGFSTRNVDVRRRAARPPAPAGPSP